MAEDHTVIAKVRGSEPERFAAITMHANWSGLKHMEFLSESDLRDRLRKVAIPDEEIESRIAYWREYAVD